MVVRLIVNADDYGHTPGVSKGIREGHLRGIVTSTTAMMNMPDVEKALERARQECPRLGIGVHLVLTTGVALLPASKVSTLVNPEGSFPGEEGLISQIMSLDLDQVRSELTAQVEKYIAITGRAPDHLDSHHHAAYFSAGICQIYLEIAQKYDCPVRFPSGRVGMDILGGFPQEYAITCNTENQELIRKYKIPSPDYFFKSFYDESCTLEYLLDALANLPEGTTEWMCHPGYADSELLNCSTYAVQRQNELALLTDEKVRKFVDNNSIELIPFGSL
jgi:chitin disaccharide deacetylase